MSRRTLRLSVEVTVSGGDDSDVLDVWIDLLDANLASYLDSVGISTRWELSDEIEAARNKAKGQISFYGSTPAYKVVLDHEGWGDVQPRLNRMSKEGKWFEMMGLITDDMLDAIGVSGTPAEVGRKLRERNAPWADRTMLTLYDETGDPDAVTDVVKAIQQGA